MTVETPYSKVEITKEPLTVSTPVPPITPQCNPDSKFYAIIGGAVLLAVATVAVMIMALLYAGSEPTCKQLPKTLWPQCIAYNTSNSKVFKCQTDSGYYVCAAVSRTSSKCKSGPGQDGTPLTFFDRAWSECIYIEGPYPYPNSNLTDIVAHCSYVTAPCEKGVKVLVGMDCCQSKPV